MQNWSGQRIAAVGGILFVVGTLVSAFIVSPPPAPDEPATKFLTYYTDHRSVLLVQGIIGAVAIAPAMLFIAGLLAALRRAGENVFGTGAILSYLLALATIVLASCWPAGVAYLAGHGLAAEQARDMTFVSFLFSIGIFALVAAGNAFSGVWFLSTRIVPSWVGAVGLVAAVPSLLGMCSVAITGAFAPFGFVAFLGLLSFMAYIALTSVVFWLKAAQPDPSTEAPAGAVQRAI